VFSIVCSDYQESPDEM